jgi:hypothetical protein
MSNFLNFRFLWDPVAFAQKNVLVANGNPVPTVKTHQSLGVTTHLSIDSAERVAYCNIETAGLGIYKSHGNIHAISISATHQKNWFPCFWLPWGPDQTYKMTLVDKRTVKTGGAPKIFLTAAVNGCSVFVEGTEQEPTVYHANAMGQNPNGFDPKTQLTAIRVDRSMLMRDRLLAIPEPKRGNGVGLRVAEGGHYMADYLQAMPQTEEQRLKDAATRWLGSKKIHYGQGTAKDKHGVDRDIGIKVSAHEGTIFGVKKGNRWAFYYQRRVSASYTAPKANATDLTRNKNWEWHSMWLSAEVVQFWPSHGSVVQRVQPHPTWPG